MRRFILSLTIAGLASAAIGVPASAATTRVVDDDGAASPGDCASTAPAPKKIQAAINQAGPGDTILVCPGTYREQPTAGHEGMTIGLSQFRDEQQVDRLPGMLALPFVGDTGNYPVNRETDRHESEPRSESTDQPPVPGEKQISDKHEYSGT